MFWFLFGHFVSDEYVCDQALEGPTVFSTLLWRAKGKKMFLTMGHIAMAHDWIRWEKRASDRGFRTVSAGGYLDHYYDRGHKLVRRDKGEEPHFHALDFYKEHRLGDPDPHLNPDPVAAADPTNGVCVKTF